MSTVPPGVDPPDGGPTGDGRRAGDEGRAGDDGRDGDGRRAGGDGVETEAERLNRNFQELLQELRVAQTGVQFLFAFLLTLAFTNRFGALDTGQRVVYVTVLVIASAAAALLIAPVSYHRMVFRQHRKPVLVRHAHRLATSGLVCMAAAIAGSVFLVVDVVFGTPLAALTAAVVAGLFITFWYILPLALSGGSAHGADR